jgi:peroxiredoxin
VAISVDSSEDSAALSAKIADEAGVAELGFPLLSDPGAQGARLWGVQMEGEELAVPATFVLDTRGDVVWARVGERVGDRPSASELLEVLDRLHVPGAPSSERR